MVLPPPAADPGAAEARGWLDRLIQPLELSREGILLCLCDATPTQLGPVVRALSPSPPWSESGEVLHVCLRATEVLEVPPGSRVLLRVRTEDLDWLNIARPLFAERKLRTVLWADAEAHEGLVRRAVDFHDWVSRTIAVPAKAVPDFAVDRLRAALERGAEIAWRGQRLHEALAAAGISKHIELHVEQPYLQLLAALRSKGLPIVSGVRTTHDAWRVRLALAETKHGTSWIALDCGQPISGLQMLHAQQTDWDEASERLRAAGWTRPALLASWLGLDPERIAAAIQRPGAPPHEHSTPSVGSYSGRDTRDAAVIAEVERTIAAEIASTESLISLLHARGESAQARTIASEGRRRSGPTSPPPSDHFEHIIRTLGVGATALSRADPNRDRELFERWIAGSQRAGNEIAARHYEPLRRCFELFGHGDASLDMVRETFAFATATPLTTDATVRAHLFRGARQILRREQPIAPLGHQISASDEQSKRTLECMRSLPLDPRLLLFLTLWEELTSAELAHVFEVPASVIYRRLADAILDLVSCMDGEIVERD